MNNLPRIAWDGQANPRNTDMPTIMYALRRADTDGLLLDSCTFDELTAENDGVMTLDALVVMAARLEPRMEILSRLMSGVGELKVVNMQTSNPLRKNGAVHVAVMWELSDGQTVSVWFHNPDTTPAKLTPMDDLVSWKWLLNKRDVTIVAAPERGTDLSPREVARRVMRLAEKNSAAFQKANANKSEKERLIAEYETANGVKRAELESLLKQLEVAQFEADNKTTEIPQFASGWTLENFKSYIKEQGKKDPLNPALKVSNDKESTSWDVVVPWDNSTGKLLFTVAWRGHEKKIKTRADAIDELFLRIQQQTILYKRSQFEADTAPKVVPAIQDDGSIKVTDKEGTQYTVSAANGTVEIRLPNGALAESYYPQNVLEINGGLKMSTGVLSAIEVDKLKVVARQMIERAALTNELLGVMKAGGADKAQVSDSIKWDDFVSQNPAVQPSVDALDAAAKTGGASIEWGFFEDAAATMDSATFDSVQSELARKKLIVQKLANGNFTVSMERKAESGTGSVDSRLLKNGKSGKEFTAKDLAHLLEQVKSGFSVNDLSVMDSATVDSISSGKSKVSFKEVKQGCRIVVDALSGVSDINGVVVAANSKGKGDDATISYLTKGGSVKWCYLHQILECKNPTPDSEKTAQDYEDKHFKPHGTKAFDSANGLPEFKGWQYAQGQDGDDLISNTAVEYDGGKKKVYFRVAETNSGKFALFVKSTLSPQGYGAKFGEYKDQKQAVEASKDAVKKYADEFAKDVATRSAMDSATDTKQADGIALDGVQAAIEELKVAMNVALNNAPINEAEGNLEQAELERKNVVEFQEAIEVLETLDVDQEWDAVPALDDDADDEFALDAASTYTPKVGDLVMFKKWKYPQKQVMRVKSIGDEFIENHQGNQMPIKNLRLATADECESLGNPERKFKAGDIVVAISSQMNRWKSAEKVTGAAVGLWMEVNSLRTSVDAYRYATAAEKKHFEANDSGYVQYDSATLDGVLLDGDFKGHPFRGNQYKQGSRESGSAVHASMKAKHAERKGDHKGAKQAHKAAHYAHMAASVGAKGKAKGYHTKMANFHATKAI